MFRRTLLFFCLLFFLLILALLLFPWNMLRGYLAAKVTAATGRQFTIDGNLRVHWALEPLVEAERVRFANTSWGTAPQMLELERAAVRVNLRELLSKRLVFPEVTLVRPNISLERNDQGKRNWILKTEENQQETDSGAVIGRLRVDEGTLLVRDAPTKTDIQLQLSTDGDAASSSAIRFSAAGKIKGMPANISGRGGSILSIKDSTLPYPLQGRAEIGRTKADVDGSVTGLASLDALDIKLKLGGTSLADLFPLLGITLPPTPPYSVSGRLVHQGSAWALNGFSGRVGESDLSGDFNVQVADKRRRVNADLISNNLDLKDLQGFIGTPDAQGGASAPEKKNSDRLLSDTPYRLERLRAMDADVKLSGRNIRGRTAIEDLLLHVKLDHGIFSAEPLNFGAAKGAITSNIKLNARYDKPEVTADISAKQLHLAELFPATDISKANYGILGGRAVLKGRGSTFAEIVGSADGTVGAAMKSGTVSSMILALAGLNIPEVIKLLLAGDELEKLNCAVFNFEANKGIFNARTLIIDAEDTNISGSGTIDMANEKLDLVVKPEPKQMRIGTLRSPLTITGSLKEPDVRPEAKAVALRAGAGAALGILLTPPAALLALADPLPAKDSDCAALLEQVKKEARLSDRSLSGQQR